MDWAGHNERADSEMRWRKSSYEPRERAIKYRRVWSDSQEKLLVLIDQRPVPKPTQVVKANSLR